MHDENKEPILEFRNVTWTAAQHLVSDISGVSIRLLPSNLAVVLQQEHADTLPVCDLASGLVEPTEGTVDFLGLEWFRMSQRQQSAMRARIGRVFEYSSWISNLTVLDNIMLSELHNTGRSHSEIRAEVETLAEKLGLSSIPDGRPDAIRPVDLRTCELIRAFLGSPDLLLLESPETGLPEGALSKLMSLLEQVLERGAAAIWLTQSVEMWKGINLRNTMKFKKKDERIIIEGEYNDA